MSRNWTHWATTTDLASLRLPAHDAGSGLSGGALGTLQRGGAFAFDPFDAYGAGLVSNPNMVVGGSIGAGKSTLVKMLVRRALERGRRVVVVDPKGEYGELARHHGVTPLVLGRDGWCNPFSRDDRVALDLLFAVMSSANGGSLSNDERFVLDHELAQLSRPRGEHVLRDLYEHLRPHLMKSDDRARHHLALALHRFIDGDLRGLFDGEGAPISFDTSLVVLDLSAQWSADSLPVALLSAVAAAQEVASSAGALGYLILDEAWALLRDRQALAWLQGSWKLARSRGLSHLLVVHRWSDVAAVGDADSKERHRGEGLLRECETAWLFRQPPDEAREMSVALGLSDLERRYLETMPRGTALVRYGAARSILRVTPDHVDATFIDTDAAMRGDVS